MWEAKYVVDSTDQSGEPDKVLAKAPTLGTLLRKLTCDNIGPQVVASLVRNNWNTIEIRYKEG